MHTSILRSSFVCSKVAVPMHLTWVMKKIVDRRHDPGNMFPRLARPRPLRAGFLACLFRFLRLYTSRRERFLVQEWSENRWQTVAIRFDISAASRVMTRHAKFADLPQNHLRIVSTAYPMPIYHDGRWVVFEHGHVVAYRQ